MRTLLIDNYDSFTFNLFQLLAAVNREEPIVVRNDEATWAELEALPCDNIVVSPVPGAPSATEGLRRLRRGDRRRATCRCSASASAIRG